jgi:hypothetical protein
MAEEENVLAPSNFGSAEAIAELRGLIMELMGRVADIESGLTIAGIPFP